MNSFVLIILIIAGIWFWKFRDFYKAIFMQLWNSTKPKEEDKNNAS